MKEKDNTVNFYPSIFNDVLSPTAPGPSSSNTVGPWRIASLARKLLDDQPISLKIEMSENGGFKDTFYSMSSDRAFIAGLLGIDLTTANLETVYATADEAKLKYEFLFTDKIEKIPSEMAFITLRSKSEEMKLTGVSLGGGEILITQINGNKCNIDGREEATVSIPETKRKVKIDSVYPLSITGKHEPVFATAEGMIHYAKKNNIALWQAALDYEQSITGKSKEDIWSIAETVLKVAYDSIEAGKSEAVKFDGITSAKAANFIKKQETLPQIPMGASEEGALDALCIMEYAAAHGTIVCMPTGGASGVIPATIRAASQKLSRSREDEIKALLTAGLIGIFYYPTHYHGALGCQAEIGIATSMAAAGLVEMLTADVDAAESAAVLAMQCLIGQICDPIEGYTQIPCFVRNISSVSIAMTCANYAVLGLDAGVNLDEMAKAVLRVGEKIREQRISDCGTCMCERKCK